MNFFKKRNNNYVDDSDFYEDEKVWEPETSSFDDEPAEAEKSTSGVAFGGGSAAVALKVMKPKSYNEGPEIADYLASGSTVLLNIENMDKVSTKRLIDFLLGATHVLGGTMNMVTNTTFVFAPKSVGVADLTANDEIEEATEDAYSEE